MRLALGLLVFSLGVTMSHETSAEPTPPSGNAAIVQGDNQFALDLYAAVGPPAAGQEPLLLAHQYLAGAGHDGRRGSRPNPVRDGQGFAPRRGPRTGPRPLSSAPGAMERGGREAGLPASRGESTMGPEGLSHPPGVPRPHATAVRGRDAVAGLRPARGGQPRDQPVGPATDQRQDQGPHPAEFARRPHAVGVDQRRLLQGRLGAAVSAAEHAGRGLHRLRPGESQVAA